MAVKVLDGGWFGATGHSDEVKRMFRTRDEADAADVVFQIVSEKKPAQAAKPSSKKK